MLTRNNTKKKLNVYNFYLICKLITDPSGSNLIQGAIQGVRVAVSGEISSWHFSHLNILAKEHQWPLTLSGSGSAKD